MYRKNNVHSLMGITQTGAYYDSVLLRNVPQNK